MMIHCSCYEWTGCLPKLTKRQSIRRTSLHISALIMDIISTANKIMLNTLIDRCPAKLISIATLIHLHRERTPDIRLTNASGSQPVILTPDQCPTDRSIIKPAGYLVRRVRGRARVKKRCQLHRHESLRPCSDIGINGRYPGDRFGRCVVRLRRNINHEQASKEYCKLKWNV
jgi:hypothetical protein